MDAYYLLAWCEDAGEWHEADQCEEQSLGRAKSRLRSRNPRLVRHSLTTVVHHSGLDYALRQNPRGMFQQLTRDMSKDLVAA